MRKIIRSGLLLLVLVSVAGNATSNCDSIFIDRLGVSNSANSFYLKSLLLGERVEKVTSKDKIILYYANIGVMNPSHKKYNVEIIYLDSKSNVVIKGAYKTQLLDESLAHIGDDIIKNTLITVGLDPKPGAMVKGQLLPLKDNNDYYIKLFVEKKLIGVTKFHYDL